MKNYPGHKGQNGVFQTIINNIPQIEIFTEVFAGSAAITKQLLKVNALPKTVFLNDIDTAVHKNLSNYFDGKRINIYKYDYYKYLQRCFKNEFLFLDPPYLHETRPNNKNLYNHELSDLDHVQLLNTVLAMENQIMIIHPKCTLYDTMLKDWRKVIIKIRYHQKTSIECLYMNYPDDLPLQTTAYIGTDCWDRQRINRKVKNMVDKVKRLPMHERSRYIEALRKEKII